MLGLLLAADGEHAVVDEQLHVLVGQPRHLGGDEQLIVLVLDVDARPVGAKAADLAEASPKTAYARRSEEVVEQPVHLAAEAGDWRVPVAPQARRRALTGERNQ